MPTIKNTFLPSVPNGDAPEFVRTRITVAVRYDESEPSVLQRAKSGQVIEDGEFANNVDIVINNNGTVKCDLVIDRGPSALYCLTG